MRARTSEWRNRLASAADLVWWPAMGHNKGKNNVKARKARRIKGERLQTAKDAAKASV